MKPAFHLTLATLLLSALHPSARAQSVIQFAAATFEVPESGGAAEILVPRTNDLDTAVTVDYFSRNTSGRAAAGLDYVAVSGTLNFAAGEAERAFTVPILNDGLQEIQETFGVVLTNATGGAVLGVRSNATVRIADNDRPLQLELASYAANEDAGAVTVRVLRGVDGDFPISIDYATSNLTAVAGEDYVSAGGTLTFAPGESLKYLTIALLNDPVRESNETFRVTLSNLSGGATLGTPAAATVTITDTDEVVQFQAATRTTREDSAFVRIGVARGESATACTVDVSTADGTAVAGVDYTGMTNTLTFAAGERLKFIDVPLLNDGVKESSESFLRILLTNPVGGAVLGTTRTVTVTVLDNDPGAGFSQSVYLPSPNSREVNVTVLRGNDGQLGPFALDYATVDGTALAGTDYEAASGSLQFKAGETLRQFAIPLLRDPGGQAAKNFTLILSNATSGTPLGLTTAQITLGGSAARSFSIVPTLPRGPTLGREAGLPFLTWEGKGAVLRADRVEGPWEAPIAMHSPYAPQPILLGSFYQIQSVRPAKVYVPARYDGQTPMPLILVLHGYGADAAWVEGYFRLTPMAEARGLLLCYPEGTLDSQGARFWNATDACCDFYGAEEDDSSYLRSVMEEIQHRFVVDRKRVYVIGFSSGGFMSHRLACDHADLIAGIASLAGVTFLDPASRQPSQPVQVLHIHGTADGSVPYEGGAGIGYPVRALIPGAVRTIHTWAELNGCQGLATEPLPSMDLDLAVSGFDTTVTRYTNCPPGGSVELWTINGGQHAPTLSSQFPEKVVDWLLAHPKP